MRIAFVLLFLVSACGTSRQTAFAIRMGEQGCLMQSQTSTPGQVAYNPVSGGMWVMPGTSQSCYKCPARPVCMNCGISAWGGDDAYAPTTPVVLVCE